ncbi:hypothetical protein WDU94_007477 [Cyamophila willieti]
MKENRKSYFINEKEENKDESGNAADGNIVLTGFNGVVGNEDCTFDNRGFQPEDNHDTSKEAHLETVAC